MWQTNKTLFQMNKMGTFGGAELWDLASIMTCRSVFHDNHMLTFPSPFILKPLRFLFVLKYPHLFLTDSLSIHDFNQRYISNLMENHRSRSTFHQNQTFSMRIILFRSLPRFLRLELDFHVFRNSFERVPT